MFKSRFSVRNNHEEKECWQTVIGYDLLWESNKARAMPTLVFFRGVVVIFQQASWSFLHRSLSSSPPGSNFLFQGDLSIIPFYPWPGLGLEYKDQYAVEWTVLENQQHPTHRTLLNAYYLKTLVIFFWRRGALWVISIQLNIIWLSIHASCHSSKCDMGSNYPLYSLCDCWKLQKILSGNCLLWG